MVVNFTMVSLVTLMATLLRRLVKLRGSWPIPASLIKGLMAAMDTELPMSPVRTPSSFSKEN